MQEVELVRRTRRNRAVARSDPAASSAARLRSGSMNQQDQSNQSMGSPTHTPALNIRQVIPAANAANMNITLLPPAYSGVFAPGGVQIGAAVSGPLTATAPGPPAGFGGHQGAIAGAYAS